MTLRMGSGLALALLGGLAVVAVSAQAGAQTTTATAEIRARDGKPLGEARLTETTAGVLIRLKVQGLPPGTHGFHAYEIGKCEGDFTSAGAIYNPLGARHGFLNEDGPMAGDLPNLIVPAGGAVEVELLSPFLTLGKSADESLLDADGAALVVRERQDDHRTDPDGNSGARIACGVLVPGK